MKIENYKLKIAVVIGIIILVVIGAFLYNKYKVSQLMLEQQPTLDQLKQAQRQEQIKTQLEALKKLREETGYKPPTQQEIKQQLKTLETLRKETNYKPPTQQEIQAQLEALKKLREQTK